MSDIKQFGSYLTFDGLQSNDYGVWISGTGTYDAPERDVEFVEIPGRSGDLMLDNNRFRNITITYPAFISKQFDSRFDIFKAAMLSRVGYKILSDTYHPGNFRLAVFRGDIQPETGPYNKAGSFDLVFECKPQLYLVAGLSIQTFTGSGGIENPTPYTALPNIRVYGYGSIGVGSETITIAETPYPYIDIDCEAMDARYMANNANSYVTVTGDVFPTLPGAVTTALTISGNITKIEIQPRWWTV